MRLRYLVLIGVLLAVCQTPIPLPGQTTDTNTPAPKKGKQQTAAAQEPATSIPAVTSSPSVSGSSSQNTTNQHKSQGNPNTVAISDFPSVSVNRDWFDYALVVFNLGLVLIGFFGVRAAIRTLRAIEKQAGLMETQIEDARKSNADNSEGVKASIAEAVRSASAMEEVAGSMAVNADSVKESVRINREIADVQKLATTLQSRAYLSAFFNAAKFQDANHVFEVQAALRNHGNTPAYDVTFRAVAQIVPAPLPEDFGFPLPDETAGTSVSLMAPGATKLIMRSVSGKVPDDQVAAIKRGDPPRCLAIWGIVKYRDAFEEARHLKFAFTIAWIGWVEGMGKDKDGNALPEQIMSYDTARHNDAD